MSLETLDQVLALAQAAHIHTLDLTGGAPEMHPHFHYLVKAARNLGIKVIDRCNLTILEDQRYEGLGRVSWPSSRWKSPPHCPAIWKKNVHKQRGKGVFKDSLAALQRLNQLGLWSARQPVAA